MSDTSNSFPTSLNSFTTTRAEAFLVDETNWNALVAAVNALETKMGIGSDTAAADELFKGTGAGSSGWAKLVNANVDAAAAIVGTKLNMYPFFAVRSANASSVTGDGTAYGNGSSVALGDSAVISNAQYSTTTGKFTAPVTGSYLFVVSCYFGTLGAGHTLGNLNLVHSNGKNYQLGDGNLAAMRDSNNNVQLVGFSLVSMNASDTIYPSVYAYNSSPTVQVNGGTSNYVSYFGGILVG
jgi:hypothetical protein